MQKPTAPVVSAEEVEKRVAYWYKHRVEMGLHEFLGWTKEQLLHWDKTQEMPKVKVAK